MKTVEQNKSGQAQAKKAVRWQTTVEKICGKGEFRAWKHAINSTN